MRLDARKHNTGTWQVWHVPTCRLLDRVVFVDDATAVWGEYPASEILRALFLSGVTPDGGMPIVEHQANKIRILPSRRLVLIDPIEDDDEEPEAIANESPVTEGTPA
jgi:hypothetical protein